MLKFKRLNVKKYTEERKTPYLIGDLLRQTTIKQIVEIVENDFTAKELKETLLREISKQLDLIIIEK